MSWLNPIIAVFMGGAMLALPHGSSKRHFFGVTVAPEHWDSEAARKAIRRYRRLILAGTAAALLTWKWIVIAPMLPCLAAVTAYLVERDRAREYAVAAGPVPAFPEGRDPLPWWTMLALPPFAALAAIALYVRSRWDDIPARFATHWGTNGAANGWSTKDFRGVYGILIFGAGVMVLMFLLGLATFYGSRRGPMRFAMLKILVGTTYLLAFVFGAVGLLPVARLSPLVFVIPVLLFVVFAIWLSWKAAESDPGDATPDECWHFGDLYYNPADPALFVQKRMGIGYTFNFANRLSWGLLAGFLAGIGGLVLLIWS